jgi:diacylglycerol O-acyltransferase
VRSASGCARSAQVRAHRDSATGPPPIAVLGGLFRLLAALGGYRWYMNHQHRMHTLVSHVRGPTQPVSLGGHPVRSAIPAAIGQGGNITVAFEVLSYAGTVTISAVVDADHFPDLDVLTDGLRAELDQIIHTPVDPGSAHRSPVINAERQATTVHTDHARLRAG